MSVLGDSAYRTNAERSLYKYFNNSLGSSFAIDWRGLKFDNKKENEWVQPRIVHTQTNYLRQGSVYGDVRANTYYGEQVNFLFQTNCFVRKSGSTLTYRHYLIRDVVNSYFPCGTTIAITDCLELSGNSTTVLGYMEVRNVVDDFPMPEGEDEDFYQYIIAWEIDFTRGTTLA